VNENALLTNSSTTNNVDFIEVDVNAFDRITSLGHDTVDKGTRIERLEDNIELTVTSPQHVILILSIS